MRRSIRAGWLAAALVVPVALAACAPAEVVRFGPTKPATAEQLSRTRDQLEIRLGVLRPGTAVRVDGSSLLVEMSARDVSPAFLEELTMPGRIAIAGIPPDGQPPAIGAAPAGEPLAGPDDVLQGAVTAGEPPTVDVVLRPDAALRLQDWTQSNVGGLLVVAVDGRVVSTPMVLEPIRGGELQISAASEESGWVAALAAALASGPLELELRLGSG